MLLEYASKLVETALKLLESNVKMQIQFLGMDARILVKSKMDGLAP